MTPMSWINYKCELQSTKPNYQLGANTFDADAVE